MCYFFSLFVSCFSCAPENVFHCLSVLSLFHCLPGFYQSTPGPDPVLVSQTSKTLSRFLKPGYFENVIIPRIQEHMLTHSLSSQTEAVFLFLEVASTS